MLKIKKWTALALMIVIGVFVLPASAGDVVLSVNSGSDSTVWFVSGEASLIMNGFDLGARNVAVPAAIDRVSLEVNSPVSGASIDVLIYQDGNGGSPADARLVSQERVTIDQSGTFTLEYSNPVLVSEPVIWVGFYLPVDFRFLADTSGSSVLTYWAWTTGGRFNVSDLSSAEIIGPADGSAPVNLNMNGKARITAEITSVATQTTAQTATTGSQIYVQPTGPDAQVNFSIMRPYTQPACDTLFRDIEDIDISMRGGVSLSCKSSWLGYAPPDPLGFARQQLLFEVVIFNDDGVNLTGWLPAKVTHCLEPRAEDIDRAVIGLAYGAPQRWDILETVRIGNLVCAEIGRTGFISYFLPTG